MTSLNDKNSSAAADTPVIAATDGTETATLPSNNQESGTPSSSASSLSSLASSASPQPLSPSESKRRQNIRDALRKKATSNSMPETITTPTQPVQTESSTPEDEGKLQAPTNPEQPAKSQPSDQAQSAEPPQPPPRADLVQAATQFLLSSRVKDAAMETKIAFLRDKKGLTTKEIEVAIQQSKSLGNNSPMAQPAAPLPPSPPVTSPLSAPVAPVVPAPPAHHQVSPPPIPMRPPTMQAQGPVYPYLPPPIPPQRQVMSPADIRLRIYQFIIGASLSYVAASKIAVFVFSHYKRFREKYANLLSICRKQLGTYLQQTLSYCEMYTLTKPADGESGTADEDSAPAITSTTEPSFADSIQQSFKNLEDKLADTTSTVEEWTTRRCPKPKDSENDEDNNNSNRFANNWSLKPINAVEDLRVALSDLSSYVSKEMYRTPTFSGFGDGPIGGKSEPGSAFTTYVNESKSEIRGIKGMLLNRRNFPAAPQASLMNNGS